MATASLKILTPPFINIQVIQGDKLSGFKCLTYKPHHHVCLPVSKFLLLSQRSKFCYPASTKAKISSNVLGPKNGPRSHSRASNLILCSIADTQVQFCFHKIWLIMAYTNLFLWLMSCIIGTIKCTCGNSNLSLAKYYMSVTVVKLHKYCQLLHCS